MISITSGDSIMKQKLAIYGTGRGASIVERYLNKQSTTVLIYFDNNVNKVNRKYNGKPVYLPINAKKIEFDYIVISVIDDGEAVNQMLSYGVQKDCIIPFFDDAFFDDSRYQLLFEDEWKLASIQQISKVRHERFEKKINKRMNNMLYEMYDSFKERDVLLPHIESAEKAIKLIQTKGYSLCRFGDYEFEIMMGRERAKYQSLNTNLAIRLKEILRSKDQNILIAIADNYGSLEKYTEHAADAIRDYLTYEVRVDHMKLLDRQKVYYDAYLSRPYIIYRDKEKASERFDQVMSIWTHRDIVVIEGDKTRMGIGNDLFSNASSVRRIIAPNKDAFDKYDVILAEALKLPDTVMFVIALGSTATVLAYDLGRAGYQAIDIGHIDNEYEWFLRGVRQRECIAGKYVNEVLGGDSILDSAVSPTEEVIANVCL